MSENEAERDSMELDRLAGDDSQITEEHAAMSEALELAIETATAAGETLLAQVLSDVDLLYGFGVLPKATRGLREQADTLRSHLNSDKLDGRQW